MKTDKAFEDYCHTLPPSELKRNVAYARLVIANREQQLGHFKVQVAIAERIEAEQSSKGE